MYSDLTKHIYYYVHDLCAAGDEPSSVAGAEDNNKDTIRCRRLSALVSRQLDLAIAADILWMAQHRHAAGLASSSCGSKEMTWRC
jgi:hypothetical protein